MNAIEWTAQQALRATATSPMERIEYLLASRGEVDSVMLAEEFRISRDHARAYMYRAVQTLGLRLLRREKRNPRYGSAMNVWGRP
jgi:hypothetical protein